MRLKLGKYVSSRGQCTLETVRMNFLIGVSGKPENIDRNDDARACLRRLLLAGQGCVSKGVRVLIGRVRR